MKGIRITAQIGPDGLAIERMSAPSPGPQEILVKVLATALNRADLLQSKGLYPAPAGVVPDIPGLEYAGEVVTCGDEVTRYKAGDRVMGLVAGGAFAEMLVTHELEAMPIPNGMTYSDAAAIPEAFCTAWDALFRQANVHLGDHVLVHAVGSGVGTAAVQLARTSGVHCAGTSRTEHKLKRARALGLELAVLCGEIPSFAAEVRRWSAGKGVEAVLDLVGGTYFSESIAAMAHQGTLMVVGLTSGVSGTLSLATVLSRRLRIQGTTMRSRLLDERIALAKAFETTVLPLFAAGTLKPVVDSVFSADQFQLGFTRLVKNASFGKIILTW
ncbi:MAG: NAD(P)H-quinone oxidoreductase [Myxococcaceae bacterium]|nr:NAD(P)H-quinone oxidoreductase [Myxococcaceae bacterium]